MPPLMDDVVLPVPPPTNDVIALVLPPKGDAATDAEPEAFGGGLVDFSELPLSPDHTSRHIWDE